MRNDRNRQRRFAFADLRDADLILDAVYEGGSFGDVRDDPLAPLVGGGNQGGIRFLGAVDPFALKQCLLYSDLSDSDWPDRLDVETGVFTYYGDNKTPGNDLHETMRQGNRVLREMFNRVHLGQRRAVPPIFVFTKGVAGREVMFRGLAVPGANGLSQTEDLVAIWKTTGQQRFQNYKAIFTILDVQSVSRQWLEALRAGKDSTAGAPAAWLEWRESGIYRPLLAPRTREHRSPREQLPTERSELELLKQIVEFYEAHPEGRYAFERCAAELFRLMQPQVHTIDLARAWRDGGRDALGLYRIGIPPSAINVEFAIEAKCKRPSPGNSSGVRETARLVARIRHRQFGVFVTTSCVGEQAAAELVEDGHPVIIVSGVDIVRILKENALATPVASTRWLSSLVTNR